MKAEREFFAIIKKVKDTKMGADDFDDQLQGLDKETTIKTTSITNYDSSMKIVTKEDPMFECKENCKCQADICTNRVVQNGPLDGLEIKSFGNKGYGLITTISIGMYLSIIRLFS